ncbi:hypothetical protein LWI29_036395 [Acer saccharum]|uniref:Uncharacterized protein n=1 Tax=Acer saccharum TaxID=4024 RepID=A0AA39VAN2_ACESA|nr:hypothetical protein LWI29_036395 [Acer saccharum]
MSRTMWFAVGELIWDLFFADFAIGIRLRMEKICPLKIQGSILWNKIGQYMNLLSWNDITNKTKGRKRKRIDKGKSNAKDVEAEFDFEGIGLESDEEDADYEASSRSSKLDKILDAGLGASFNANGDGDGDSDSDEDEDDDDEDNNNQDNEDEDNDDLVLLHPLSISGLLLFGFVISHRVEFRRLGLCVIVSLRHGNSNVVWVWVCA